MKLSATHNRSDKPACVFCTLCSEWPNNADSQSVAKSKKPTTKCIQQNENRIFICVSHFVRRFNLLFVWFVGMRLGLSCISLGSGAFRTCKSHVCFFTLFFCYLFVSFALASAIWWCRYTTAKWKIQYDVIYLLDLFSKTNPISVCTMVSFLLPSLCSRSLAPVDVQL